MKPWENYLRIWEEDLMALTLWKRELSCIKRLFEVICEHLGVTIDELEESLINDDEAASAYLVMAKALEDREQTKNVHETLFR